MNDQPQQPSDPNQYGQVPQPGQQPYGQQAYPQQAYDPNQYPQQAYDPNQYPQQSYSQQAYDPNQYQGGLVPVAPAVPMPYAMTGPGPVGKVRSTGICILLAIVTFGIYTVVWYYLVHDEMKRHSGQGLGGGLALVLALLVGFVMPYITSSEVGNLYNRTGQKAPVSGMTGLWYFPGMFIIVGPLIWFIQTNSALNSYWRSLGAV